LGRVCAKREVVAKAEINNKIFLKIIDWFLSKKDKAFPFSCQIELYGFGNRYLVRFGWCYYERITNVAGDKRLNSAEFIII
jgi:hypothetical protein